MASEDQSPATTQEKDVEDMPLVPVRIPHSLDTQGQAADYGGWVSYHLAGTEQPQPILPFDSFRHRATIVAGPATPVVNNGGASYTGDGEATLPTTGAVVASLNSGTAIPAGNYTISGTVTLAATVTQADINNMGLYVGSTLVSELLLGNSGASAVPIPSQIITVPQGGAVVSIKTTGPGSGTANYYASFAATPFSSTPAAFIYLGTQAQCLTKTAGQLAAGQQIIIENNQQLWMAPDGTDPLVISVLAERWDSGT
jgi:hypothetical protein